MGGPTAADEDERGEDQQEFKGRLATGGKEAGGGGAGGEEDEGAKKAKHGVA